MLQFSGYPPARSSHSLLLEEAISWHHQKVAVESDRIRCSWYGLEDCVIEADARGLEPGIPSHFRNPEKFLAGHVLVPWKMHVKSP